MYFVTSFNQRAVVFIQPLGYCSFIKTQRLHMITLPVYYSYKTKEGIETILVGLNKYERMYYIPRNEMKKYYYSLIKSKLKNIKINGQVKTHYTYFYKNSASDAPNVVAIIDKLFMDELQNSKVIKDDNVKHYIGSTWEVGSQDKDNPRMEIRIFEVA